MQQTFNISNKDHEILELVQVVYMHKQNIKDH